MELPPPCGVISNVHGAVYGLYFEFNKGFIKLIVADFENFTDKAAELRVNDASNRHSAAQTWAFL